MFHRFMIFSFEQFFNPLLENSVVFETKSFQSMIISIVTFYRIYILQRDVKSQLIESPCMISVHSSNRDKSIDCAKPIIRLNSDSKK